MNIEAKRTTDYVRVLSHVWANDASLLTTHHAIASPTLTLAEAVSDSVAVLTGPLLAQDFAFYALWDGTEIVGFVGVEPGNNCLITFGLGVHYRYEEMKEALWYWIRTFTDANRPALCVLHSHNERAQRFLESGGARIIDRIVYEGKHGTLFLL